MGTTHHRSYHQHRFFSLKQLNSSKDFEIDTLQERKLQQ